MSLIQDAIGNIKMSRDETIAAFVLIGLISIGLSIGVFAGLAYGFAFVGFSSLIVATILIVGAK